VAHFLSSGIAMSSMLKAFVEHRYFQNAVVGLILFSVLLMGQG